MYVIFLSKLSFSFEKQYGFGGQDGIDFIYATIEGNARKDFLSVKT